MSEDNSQLENKSTYAKIEIPDLKSDIPEYLTRDSSEPEKYILAQLSILTQHAKWSSQVLLDVNSNVRRTNGRLIKVENWKGMFSSWWILAGALISIVGGVVGVLEIIRFFGKV